MKRALVARNGRQIPLPARHTADPPSVMARVTSQPQAALTVTQNSQRQTSEITALSGVPKSGLTKRGQKPGFGGGKIATSSPCNMAQRSLRATRALYQFMNSEMTSEMPR